MVDLLFYTIPSLNFDLCMIISPLEITTYLPFSNYRTSVICHKMTFQSKFFCHLICSISYPPKQIKNADKYPSVNMIEIKNIIIPKMNYRFFNTFYYVLTIGCTAVARTLIGGGGVYSYIHVLPD